MPQYILDCVEIGPRRSPPPPSTEPLYRARYDLARNPVNFNFLEFLVGATTRGATEIYLDLSRGFTKKYTAEDSETRLFNIVLPACQLTDVSVSFGSHGHDHPYHISATINAFKEMGFIKKLKSPLGKRDVKYTVTLRDYTRSEQRNSNRDAWEKFASDIGAMVIDDWYKTPISLHERMALYSGAEMNFHVNGGPVNLCFYSDAPFLGFMKMASLLYHEHHGFPAGSQLPWLNSRQRFVWKMDTYDNIRRAWDEMQEAA